MARDMRAFIFLQCVTRDKGKQLRWYRNSVGKPPKEVLCIDISRKESAWFWMSVLPDISKKSTLHI